MTRPSASVCKPWLWLAKTLTDGAVRYWCGWPLSAPLHSAPACIAQPSALVVSGLVQSSSLTGHQRRLRSEYLRLNPCTSPPSQQRTEDYILVWGSERRLSGYRSVHVQGNLDRIPASAQACRIKNSGGDQPNPLITAEEETPDQCLHAQDSSRKSEAHHPHPGYPVPRIHNPHVARHNAERDRPAARHYTYTVTDNILYHLPSTRPPGISAPGCVPRRPLDSRAVMGLPNPPRYIN